MQSHSEPSGTPRQTFAGRLEARRSGLALRERRYSILTTVRVLMFLTALATAFAALAGRLFAPWWLLAPVAVFWWVGGRLQQVESERTRFSRSVNFYERALARLDHRWSGTGKPASAFSTIATCMQETWIFSAGDRCLNRSQLPAPQWDRRHWQRGS